MCSSGGGGGGGGTQVVYQTVDNTGMQYHGEGVDVTAARQANKRRFIKANKKNSAGLAAADSALGSGLGVGTKDSLGM